MRWGIVGFGWVARDYMAPAIVEAGGQMVSVCDPDPAARSAAAAMGSVAVADIGSLLTHRLDAVYVATPNHLHRAAVSACAEAGVAILCEKPLAASLQDADAVVDVCRRAGVLLGSAFDQRHHAAHRAIREAIAAGRIGTVTAIRIVYGCWVDRNWSAGSGAQNWRIDPIKAGGGAVIDLAPHGIDLVDALLGEPLVTLNGLLQARVQDYPVDDGGMLVGRTGSGVLVSLHNSYNTPETLPRRRLEIVGTLGAITAENTMGQTPGGTVTLTNAADGSSEDLPFGQDESPFAAQARAFAHAVAGRPHSFDAERDLRALRLLMSVTETQPSMRPHDAHAWPRTGT